MLEGYYLSGLPIDLTKFNLGTIYQPIYKELIENQIDLDKLLRPFLLKKEMVKEKMLPSSKEKGSKLKVKRSHSAKRKKKVIIMLFIFLRWSAFMISEIIPYYSNRLSALSASQNSCG